MAGIHGILLLDKPLGLSSNQALGRAKRLLGADKAGHTGALDPLATGMLPCCFGEATKIAGVLLGAAKAYRAQVALGATTTTGDREGPVERVRAVPAIDAAALAPVLARFQGRIRQRPPAYSALKRDGIPLYRLARRGEPVEAPERDVEIFELTAPGPGRDRPVRAAGCRGGPAAGCRRGRLARLRNRCDLRFGHLHPQPRGRHRRGPGLRRAPGRTAAAVGRAFRGRRPGHPGGVGGRAAGRARRRLPAAGWRPACATGAGSTSMSRANVDCGWARSPGSTPPRSPDPAGSTVPGKACWRWPWSNREGVVRVSRVFAPGI